MEKIFYALALAICAVFLHTSRSSRIRIEDSGYKDILIALPSNVPPRDRARIITTLKNLFQYSSSILEVSTKGRAQFHSSIILVPRNWGSINSWHSPASNSTTFVDAGAAFTRENADIIVTDSEDINYPYTLHHKGCGQPALRIYLPLKFLLSGNLRQKSVEFIRLWSEYRYGVFPEGGFKDDSMYPETYGIPEELGNNTTGCKDETLWIPRSCPVDDQCSENPISSSLMDQNLPPTATRFCESEYGLGPKHKPHSPSKHNLLCGEEGTYFTILRSPDFAKGKNAARKYLPDNEVSFHYARESAAPRFVVAIEISARMKLQSRYSLTKNAFSKFVYADVPKGSEVTLFVFGGNETRLINPPFILDDENSRITYLESQLLPEEPIEDEMVCTDCVFDDIFQLIGDTDNHTMPSADIVLVTTRRNLNAAKFPELQQKIIDSESRLHVMFFADDNTEHKKEKSSHLDDLCSETGGQFISMSSDLFGDLYRGFAAAVAKSESDVLILQYYLVDADDEHLTLSFPVDENLSRGIRVLISGPSFNIAPLDYDSTFLTLPNNDTIIPVKQEILPAWTFEMSNPQVGQYILSTKRKEGARNPVLVTVTGMYTSKDDFLTVRTWAEFLPETKSTFGPVQIFAEVRKGCYPVSGASVIAFIRHPNDMMIGLELLDDGLGDLDVTKEDGVYGRYFTSLTKVGFYNVYVNVDSGANGTARVLEGPADHCCGCAFSWNEKQTMTPFQRQAGPFTFEVTESNLNTEDIYPPARITDLRLFETYDQFYVLQWTAVGNDYDDGFAPCYELKLFSDRALIRNRFFDSGLELYQETIRGFASYGTALVHVVRLPKIVGSEGGVRYFAIRAVDDAGNAGEPSNTLPVWVQPTWNSTAIDCNEELPEPEKTNSASILTPIASLIFCVFIFYHL